MINIDIDENAVARAVAGDPPSGLAKVDRREAVRRLTERGVGYRTIAARLRIDPSTVARDRRHLGLRQSQSAVSDTSEAETPEPLRQERSAVTYRVILTGSRWWTQPIIIRAVLGDLQLEHGANLVLVHGACPTGADAIGDLVAAEFGIRRDPFPAAWNHCAPTCPKKPHRKPRKTGDVHHPGVLPDYCPGAGPRRNLAMARRGAQEFIAFAAAERSFGTANMIKLAREHGIGGRKWTPGRGTPITLPPLVRRGAA